jgi:hydroxymethylglutaryl-CoA synthase
VFCLSGALPGPGSYVTVEMCGTPVLVTRAADRRVRAMANVCRHRGVRVVDGNGEARRFTCPSTPGCTTSRAVSSGFLPPVAGDVRTGLPRGADELEGGDAVAAFVCAPSSGAPALAEVVGAASSSVEFLDRWRAPGDVAARVWEERFGESAYVPAAESVVTDACKQAGFAVDAVDHLVVAGLHARAIWKASCRSTPTGA